MDRFKIVCINKHTYRSQPGVNNTADMVRVTLDMPVWKWHDIRRALNIDYHRNIEVWSEGFCTNECSSIAKHHGTVEADNFQQACDKVLGDMTGYDRNNLTLNGCHLFDSEVSARKTFG